jgi:ketosteroid isomerase-like protein
MRRRWLIPIAAVGVTMFLASQSTVGLAQSSSAAVSSEITKLERTWETAMHAKDAATVEGIVASSWVGLNPDGSSDTRAHFVAGVKKGDYATVKLDTIDVTVAGATAIAHGKASDKDGKYAYSDVFVQEGGKWHAVFSQIALLPPPPPKK